MDKYIFHKRRALTLKERENIIDFFEETTKVGNHHDQKRVEVERQYTCVAGDIRDKKYKNLFNILSDSLNEYTNKHNFLKTLCWGITKGFNIQKYQPGDVYDVEHMEHGPAGMSHRVLVWMFYLNSIKKNGGTCWPQQNFTSKPRGGDLYIWPAAWTHSHHGIAAPNEIKYIITGWCEFL